MQHMTDLSFYRTHLRAEETRGPGRLNRVSVVAQELGDLRETPE